METPTSAYENAGESFTPSPIIIHFLPVACSAATYSALSSGSTQGIIYVFYHSDEKNNKYSEKQQDYGKNGINLFILHYFPVLKSL